MRRDEALDRPRHRTVASPLLSVGEVRDGVEVGGDELTARVLVDAELRVPIRSHQRVMRESSARALADAELCVLDLVVADLPRGDT